MKAIELSGLEGFKSLRVADVAKPRPAANQILIEVMAAGINFAELELTWGRYPALKPLPYVLGFEAAGIVVEIGLHVKNVRVGDKVAAIVSRWRICGICHCRCSRCHSDSQWYLLC
jgi:NADPH2:quinone reductase